jgi:hypothetical protein
VPGTNAEKETYKYLIWGVVLIKIRIYSGYGIAPGNKLPLNMLIVQNAVKKQSSGTAMDKRRVLLLHAFK